MLSINWYSAFIVKNIVLCRTGLNAEDDPIANKQSELKNS